MTKSLSAERLYALIAAGASLGAGIVAFAAGLPGWGAIGCLVAAIDLGMIIDWRTA